MSKLMTLAADPAVESLLFPFTPTPLPPKDGGWYLGPQLGFRRPVYLSPWFWQQPDSGEGIIGSTQCEVTCEIGKGKSTLIKSLIAQASMSQVARDGVPAYYDILVNSQRREGKADEYAAVVKNLGGYEQPLRTARFNPFRREVYVDGQTGEIADIDVIETALLLSEIVSPTPVLEDESLAFQIAVRRMISDDIMHPGYLEHLLRTQDESDKEEYFRSSNKKLLAELEAETKNRADVLAQLKLSLERPVNMLDSDFRRASSRAANRIGALLRGHTGGTFGSEMGQYAPSDAHLKLRDWSGLGDVTQTALATFFLHLESIAITRHRTNELFDFVVEDEQHARIQNPANARAAERRARMARQVKTFRIMLNQYAGDTARIGEPGSALRGHGEAIDRSQGFFMVGPQPDDDKIKTYLASKRVGEPDIGYITQYMPKYCFALIIPGWPGVVYFRRIVGPHMLAMSQTNSASASQLERIVPDDNFFEHYIRLANRQPGITTKP